MQVVAAPRGRGGERGGAAGEWEHAPVTIDPVRALQIALLVFVTGNVGRIPLLDLGDRAAPLLFNDLAIITVVTIGAIAMVHARSARLNDVAVAALVFAAIGGLSAIAGVQRFGFNTLEVVASLAYLGRWLLYFTLYVVVINCVRARDTEALWKTLEAAMLLIAAFGIVQAIFLPNFAFIVFPESRESVDFDVQRNRLVSTILEPNVAAGMIIAILLVQLARLAFGARIAWWKPLVMLTALVMTLSRGGMFAFGIGCMALVAIRGVSRRLLAFGALALAGVVAALPKLLSMAKDYSRFAVSDDSTVARLIVWQRSLETFLEHPWFGIGFNTYGFVQDRRGFARLGGSSYSAEGGLLFIAVLTGIVGLAVYLAMLTFVLRRCRAGWRNPAATPEERGLLVGTAIATIAILIHTVFVNLLLTPWVLEPLWILWGLSFVVAASLRTRSGALTT